MVNHILCRRSGEGGSAPVIELSEMAAHQQNTLSPQPERLTLSTQEFWREISLVKFLHPSGGASCVGTWSLHSVAFLPSIFVASSWIVSVGGRGFPMACHLAWVYPFVIIKQAAAMITNTFSTKGLCRYAEPYEWSSDDKPTRLSSRL